MPSLLSSLYVVLVIIVVVTVVFFVLPVDNDVNPCGRVTFSIKVLLSQGFKGREQTLLHRMFDKFSAYRQNTNSRWCHEARRPSMFGSAVWLRCRGYKHLALACASQLNISQQTLCLDGLPYAAAEVVEYHRSGGESCGGPRPLITLVLLSPAFAMDLLLCHPFLVRHIPLRASLLLTRASHSRHLQLALLSQAMLLSLAGLTPIFTGRFCPCEFDVCRK